MTTSETPDVDRLVSELKTRVEERRHSGQYPVELEERLAEHFNRINSQRPAAPDFRDLYDGLDRLDDLGGFSRSRIELDSKVPGGTSLHRAVTKAVSRQTDGVLTQVQQFSDEIRELLRSMVATMEDPSSHVHADLIGHIDALYERISAYERQPEDANVVVPELQRRVEMLEAAEAERVFKPWFSNDAFEAAFRGSRTELLSRYRDLAQHLEGCGPVLDIGCGRGEFLELLGEIDVEATGVEIDPDLARECRELGLRAQAGDGLAALAAAPDASLGGIVLIQVVEHLPQQRITDLAILAAAKLRPGGKIIIETVNPQSLYVYAHAFYLDPTHTRPVHPAYLTFLLREAGIPNLYIDWRSEPGEEESLVLSNSGNDDSVMNKNVERLNQILFAPQDYALIATR